MDLSAGFGWILLSIDEGKVSVNASKGPKSCMMRPMENGILS